MTEFIPSISDLIAQSIRRHQAYLAGVKQIVATDAAGYTVSVEMHAGKPQITHSVPVPQSLAFPIELKVTGGGQTQTILLTDSCACEAIQ